MQHDEPLAICTERYNALSKKIDQQNEKLDRLVRSVCGTMDEPDSLGILTRLDRLEQREEARSWLVRGCSLAAAGLVIERVWEYVFTFKKG